ncbi:MAG: hypothetical protein EZS28_038140, partial [Streblomastix strix]
GYYYSIALLDQFLSILIPIPPIPIVTPNLSASIPTTLSIPIGDNPVRIATLGSNISIYILPFVKYLAVSHQVNNEYYISQGVFAIGESFAQLFPIQYLSDQVILLPNANEKESGKSQGLVVSKDQMNVWTLSLIWVKFELCIII